MSVAQTASLDPLPGGSTARARALPAESRPRPGGPLGVHPGDYHDVATIRTEPAQAGGQGWIGTASSVFVNVPRMASSFVATEDHTAVAVTFSAEARSSVVGKGLLIRVLIDGAEADPGSVVFTDGLFQGTRSFTFAGSVGRGIHTAEVQWRAESGTTGQLRATSLVVRKGPGVSNEGTVTVVTGTNETTTTTGGWIPIDSMVLAFFVPPNATTFLQFSSETEVLGVDKSLWVRALVDGQPTKPGDVVFARSDERQTHTMVFGAHGLVPGWHTATMEWNVTAGGIGAAGKRCLAVASYASGNGLTHELYSPPSGPSISTTSTTFEPVPGLSAFVLLPRNAEATAVVSAEAFSAGGEDLSVRLRVGSQVSEEVVFCAGTIAGAPTETQSFSFDVKHLFPQNLLVAVPLQVEWKVSSATANVALADRSLAIVVEEGAIPDLAEAQNLGRLPVEPVIGSRKLLTILYDPHRPANLAPPAFLPATVTDLLFGTEGVADYFSAVSGGRFTIENAGVLGWYDAWKPWGHYWAGAHSNGDCDVLPDPEFNDGFSSGHQERLYEAIAMADNDFDFAAYDTNGDGVLDWRTELGIMIVTPQWNESGSHNGNLIPFCPQSTMTVDGVEIRVVTEWFTALNTVVPWITGAHELAHNYLSLGDMYVDDTSTHTEPRRFSLLGNPDGSTSHIDGPSKLALGWAEPVPILESDLHQLEDVKWSERVFVLPRRADGDGREYFALENRQTSADHPLFDEGILCTGILVWHVVEDSDQNAQPSLCMTQEEWEAASNYGDNTRRGLRLLRPMVSVGLASLEAWHDVHYDLFDSGAICPVEGDEPGDRRNALVWADGSPSGYGVLGFSPPAQIMSFDVLVP